MHSVLKNSPAWHHVVGYTPNIDEVINGYYATLYYTAKDPHAIVVAGKSGFRGDADHYVASMSDSQILSYKPGKLSVNSMTSDELKGSTHANGPNILGVLTYIDSPATCAQNLIFATHRPELCLAKVERIFDAARWGF